MSETNDLNLRYTVNVMCLAEASLGKPLSVIFEELESEQGASLMTLRALVAAGRVHLNTPFRTALVPGINAPLTPFYDENAAGKLIDDHGINEVAGQVGVAIRGFVKKIAGGVNV